MRPVDLSPALRAALFQKALQGDLSTFVGAAFKAVNPGEAYAPNWHIHAMCHQLEEVYAGRTQRLLITMPPRYLKSLCISIAFPAWALGKDPSLKLIVASYGAGLAQQHARDFGRVINAPLFKGAFPTLGAADRHTVDNFVTRQNGGRRSVSVGGPVTGLGADIIIVDDLLKAADADSPTERQKAQDFYVNTLLSRLNDKKTGRIIVVQQRLHEEDLAGYLMKQGGFEHLNLPAIAEEPQTYCLGRYGRKERPAGELLFEEREPKEVLDRIRSEVGRGVFSAQYQQNPLASDEQIIRWDKIKFYKGSVAREDCLQVVQSWDTAVSDAPTADFSACTTYGFHENDWKLLDVYRARLAFPDLLEKAKALHQRWRADYVLIENAGSGISLLQSLRREQRLGRGAKGVIHTVPMPVHQSKELRLRTGAVLLESGEVQFPEDAPWMPEFRRELLAFPGINIDDQVDSVSQFLAYAAGRRSNARLEKAANGGRPTGTKKFRRIG